MLDPIGAFERIRDFYISYLETAFYIRKSVVSADRRRLLEESSALCAEPIIEPLTRYESTVFWLEELAHHGLDDPRLPGLNAVEREAFVRLVLSGLFESKGFANGLPKSKYRPFKHQAEMLCRGVCSGQPAIVTSGTGSGKTEAFLLPVFARLAKEALTWPAPDRDYLSHRWWQDTSGRPLTKYTALPNRPSRRNPDFSPFIPQRTGERRPAAVRSLILYPMNALVEDQLARLRRSLDSEEARRCMSDTFKNNRLFLGKYTSATPVTGHHRDLNGDTEEYKRRDRKLQQLFRASCQMQRTQEAARLHNDEDAHYLFPSVDGHEMTSRWDMQEAPPDILITNTSMLNAMLAREVDAPIFQKTRDWILSNDDAYFFLVLDELHLQRGSAGTEVSLLLRLLIERLGLDDPKHRQKLHILASSASMPTQGELGDTSLQYLWDFFGSNGTWNAPGQDDARTKTIWREAIVEGSPIPVLPCGAISNPEPLIQLLRDSIGTSGSLAQPSPPQNAEELWRAICKELVPELSNGDLRLAVKSCIEQAGFILESACTRDSIRRPLSISNLCIQLFGVASNQTKEAVRALLFIRGLGDVFLSWFPGSEEISTVSFRIHLFYRSIEGLFAPAMLDVAVPQGEQELFGPLSVERGLRFVKVGEAKRRLLELIYCECCGEMFFAGMKGKRRDSSYLELLPIDPDLDGLPDAAMSQLFEELTAESFGVFWPSAAGPAPSIGTAQNNGEWRRACLEPVTGVVRIANNRFDPWASPSHIHGFLYMRSATRDRHGRSSSDAGSCVPYGCPACGISYERRKRGYRLSPLRNFRTGFAKTTQLLATEVFEVLGKSSDNPKLVSFSDSRQDAAKAALDIERRHHEDLSRQILVEAILEVAKGRPSVDALRAAEEKTKKAVYDADPTDPTADELTVELKRLRQLLRAAGDSSIPLSEIVETLDDISFYGPRPERNLLRPYLAKFAELGVHPVDGTGVRSFHVRGERLEWFRFFEVAGSSIDWKDYPQMRNEFDQVRRELVETSIESIAQTIFNKTYFSLEKTGLGYPTVPLSAVRDVAEQDAVASYIRVLGDSYRVNESPFDDTPKDWTSVNDIGPNERIFRFATAAMGNPQQAALDLGRILDVLNSQQHTGGIIHTGKINIKVPAPNDPYWRCERCGRIHLHLGKRVCTRCFERLDNIPTGQAAEIRQKNFLGKRVERGEPPFRVRCEELTGQTDDPAERQRRFRGIIFDAPSQLEEKAKFIDLLAVTTTMEVGIDIGPLQAVFQANMPPQRFNYQQRVGRAGRRGQAFSLVMTVCRSKSHDLHYYRNPDRITGEPPPPPFLTKRQEIIPRRLLRKAWLATAFDNLRARCRATGERYPGDDASPDIHGEFMPSGVYFDATRDWPNRLRIELESTISDRDRFAAVLSSDSELSTGALLSSFEPDDLIADIEESLSLVGAGEGGLAHMLAEAGRLPMFGMPTRVRNLYIDAVKDNEEYQYTWSTIDRDLDYAIFEFAPGGVIVKDKQQHRPVGFTGRLSDVFRPGSRNSPQPLSPYGPAFSDPFWLLKCRACGSWRRFDERPVAQVCETCNSPLIESEAGECRTPAGFRTDLRPRIIKENDRFGSRNRSITAESRRFQLSSASEGSNLSLAFLPQTRTYRLNRGPDETNDAGVISPRGFTVEAYSHQIPSLQHTRLDQQSIAIDCIPEIRVLQPQPDPNGLSADRIWLSAPKTTDSLFVAATNTLTGLRIDRVSGEISEGRVTSVRSAAVSATFILVHRAALDLDVDPDEFDIIDPRIHMSDGHRVPVLQVADHLVNGSGLCDRLATADRSGTPLVAKIIHSIVSDQDAFPLRSYRAAKDGIDHAGQCDQSCYLCLQRYGNQPYHGLLDWRLGLSFLEALDSTEFSCGLNGDFQSSPSLSDWPELARRYATDLVNNYGVQGEVASVGPLTIFRLDQRKNEWNIVVHPLWNTEEPSGILADCVAKLCNPRFSDTFELSRRQVTERERLQREWNS